MLKMWEALLNRWLLYLVILDLMLPDITGEEICKALRKKSIVPIIGKSK